MAAAYEESRLDEAIHREEKKMMAAAAYEESRLDEAIHRRRRR